MEASEVANSFPMWIACALAVLVVVAQAVIFGVQAYRSGERVGLTKKQMKKAMRSAAITSLGPSVVILSGMLSLLITVGGPMAWMRLSMIGSVMFEATAAGIGAGTAGVELGTDPLTLEALGMAVWTMVLCSVGWVIFATLFADKMNQVRLRFTGGDSNRMIRVSASAIIGVFAAMAAPQLIRVTGGGRHGIEPHASACILGGLFMALMMRISRRFPVLKEWNLTIAILLAAVTAALVG